MNFNFPQDVRTDRLRQLGEYLLTGKLGHKRFWFGFFNSGIPHGGPLYTDPRLVNCGTTGCALGECPFIWEEWSFSRQCQPVIAEEYNTLRSACSFFGLMYPQAYYLFWPYNEGTHAINNGLTNFSTREEVANHILKFADEYDRRGAI